MEIPSKNAGGEVGTATPPSTTQTQAQTTAITSDPSSLPPPPPAHPRTMNDWSIVPPGWSTAVSPEDGQMYYYEQATGRTSWTHPAYEVPATVGSQGLIPHPSLLQQQQQPQQVMQHQQPQHDHLQPVPFGNSSSFDRKMLNFWNSGSATNRNHPSINKDNLRMAMTPAEYYDTPDNASRRPKNHQMYAVCSLFLFFPIGIFAMYHSLQVDAAWKQARFGDSWNHSRQARQYSGFGNFCGLIFWIWLLFFREPRVIDWKWPDFDFDMGGGGGG